MSYPPNYPRGYPPPAPGYYPPPAGGYYPPPQSGPPPPGGYYPPPQPGQPPAGGYYPQAQPRPQTPGYYPPPGYPPAGPPGQTRPPQPYYPPQGGPQPPYQSQYGEAFYFVKSKLNGLVLDVEGGAARPGVKVFMWHQKPEAEANNQLWHQDPYSGTIKSKLAPNLCLTPTVEGLCLQEVHPGQADQQLTVSEERIHLRNDRNLVLDIAQANSTPCAKVILYQNNGAVNQKWEFVRAGTGVGAPTYPNPAVLPSPAPGGEVRPSAPLLDPVPSSPPSTPSGPSRGAMLAGAVAAGAAAGAAAASAAQNAKLEEKVEKRPFYIKTDLGDKVLDVKGACLEPGTQVIIYDRQPDVQANQLWCVDEKGLLRSKLNQFAIDTSSGKARLQPEKHGDPNQQWYLDGRKILNKAHPNECLDVKKAKCKNNQSTIPYPYTAKTNQHWTIDYINL